ncbi:hypothetical protein [Actinoallomurus soli]|uniref:hypothetical protein n=1 Tax=Actinoallomurus soli TaxID=2952535 RepID=UPI00209393D4|nr:hypothetical protein [Actinoallomurus soli]MCO5967986.1 hypothetical protein [Actinoallomurus soli]
MTTLRISRRVGMLSVAAAAAFALVPMASAQAAPVKADGSVTTAGASKKTYFTLSGLGTRLSGIPKGKAWVGWHDGTLTDKAEWSVRVTDIASGKWCAQARIILDVPGNDVEYTSGKACGKGKHLDWKKTSTGKAFLRGVKVQVCQNLPVSNAQQKCVTKKYIKNPYYHY